MDTGYSRLASRLGVQVGCYPVWLRARTVHDVLVDYVSNVRQARIFSLRKCNYNDQICKQIFSHSMSLVLSLSFRL